MDYGNPRYAASKKSSYCGNLIGGRHTTDGFYKNGKEEEEEDEEKSNEDGENISDGGEEKEDDEAQEFNSVYDEMTYISDKKLDEITLASSYVASLATGAPDSEYSKTCAHLEQKLAKH